MSQGLKADIVERLKQVGACDVRIANPRIGFEHGLQAQQPLTLWPEGMSVIVFAVAMAPRTNNIYAGPLAPWEAERNLGPVPRDICSVDYGMDRLSRLFVSSVTLKGVAFLQQRGYKVGFVQLQLKLCAFESGLGVYGRSGLIIHPTLGNRMSIGAIFTDAEMEPDDRLSGFEPCTDCDLCIRRCPAKAFDPDKTYPESWSRAKCTSKRSEIAKKGYYCHNCFAVCPAGRMEDEKLLSFKESVNFYKPIRREWRKEYVRMG